MQLVHVTIEYLFIIRCWSSLNYCWYINRTSSMPKVHLLASLFYSPLFSQLFVIWYFLKQKHSNLINGILLVVVALPALWIGWYLRAECPAQGSIFVVSFTIWAFTELVYLIASTSSLTSTEPWWTIPSLCRLAINHPVWAANVIYFFNVNVLFYIISLFQDSTWVCVIWDE